MSVYIKNKLKAHFCEDFIKAVNSKGGFYVAGGVLTWGAYAVANIGLVLAANE